MTPPDATLHERLEKLAVEIPAGTDRRLTAFEHELISALREAAAAMRQPEGEVGELCERLGRGFEDAAIRDAVVAAAVAWRQAFQTGVSTAISNALIELSDAVDAYEAGGRG